MSQSNYNASNRALFNGGAIVGFYRRLIEPTPVPGQLLNNLDGLLMMQQAAQDIDIPLDRLLISRYRLIERRQELQEKVWHLESLDQETTEYTLLKARLNMMDNALWEIDQQIQQLNPFQKIVIQAEKTTHNQKLVEWVYMLKDIVNIQKILSLNPQKEALSKHIEVFNHLEQLIEHGLSTPFGVSPSQLAAIITQYDRQLCKANKLAKQLNKQ